MALIDALIGPIASIIDKIIPDKEAQAKAKVELLTLKGSQELKMLETQLEACAFTPCGSQDISRFGWVKPLGKFGSTLTHSAAGHILLCARKEEKMLPGSVVKEMLAEKVEAIEFEQGRALKKKEKEALKEEIMHTLLPRAFSRTSQTFAWINPADNLMVVDAGSAKKADDLLALLRKSIGTLPVMVETTAAMNAPVSN